jgi:hypothetical protein
MSILIQDPYGPSPLSQHGISTLDRFYLIRLEGVENVAESIPWSYSGQMTYPFAIVIHQYFWLPVISSVTFSTGFIPE